MKNQNKFIYLRNTGFTVVELLVIIVILGILASLVAFSYRGWQTTIAEKEVRYDLTTAVTAIKNAINFSEGSITTLPGTYKPSDRVKVTFIPGSGTTFCIDGVSNAKSNIMLFVREDGTVKKGTCAGGEITDFYAEGSLIASSITGGLNHSCAISAGKAYCWGNNAQGQLGNNSTTSSLKPVPVDTSGALNGKTVTQIAAGMAYTCAVADNAIYCWGSNMSGQFGNGSVSSINRVPVATTMSGVLSGKTVTQLTTGDSTTCAIASNDAYCWGADNFGQLGNNTTLADSLVPVAVLKAAGALSLKTITDIDTSPDHTCVVASGEAWCWGANTYGKLGLSAGSTTSYVAIPYQVTTQNGSGALYQKTVTSIEGGSTLTCAVASGAPYCWGKNDWGQLGNNNSSMASSTVPVAVSTAGALSGKTSTKIAVSVNHACVIASGTANCWGRNDDSNLGIGNNTQNQSYIPLAVSTAGVLNGKSISTITTGANYTCALSGVEAFCWGQNNQGQLGNNSNSFTLVPVKVSNP